MDLQPDFPSLSDTQAMRPCRSTSSGFGSSRMRHEMSSDEVSAKSNERWAYGLPWVSSAAFPSILQSVMLQVSSVLVE